MAKKKTLDGVALARKTAGLLFEKKAEDMALLDLRGLSSLTDFYLICTCQNETQMRGILNSISRALSREGTKPLRSEYHAGVRWAILDYGDLIVHLFEKDTRNYYSLERLWADAKTVRLRPEDYAPAEGQRNASKPKTHSPENGADEDEDL